MNIDSIWRTRVKRTRSVGTGKVDYDVRITLNKNGRSQKQKIRFGLTNNAADVFKDWNYIEISSPVLLSNRIYFRKADKNTRGITYKLGESCPGHAGINFSFMPTEAEEKILRNSWLNIGRKLKYDEDNNLYYIENRKDAE